MSAEQQPLHGHERGDFRFRGMVFAVIVLGILISVAMWGMGVMFDWLQAGWQARDTPPSPLADTVERPAVPLLQTRPPQELEILRRSEESQLESYQWVDPEQGIVRIPIDRAIDILAEQGLPHREEE